MQKYRIISFVSIHILILVHVLWIKDAVIGSLDFQEFFDRFLGNGILNAGSIMVIFAFLSTLIFGRFFCGWLCHFGAVQELAWWVFDKLGIKTKTINSRLITFLPLFILFNFYIVPNIAHFFTSNSVPWVLSVDLSETKIWDFLPGFLIGTLTFVIDGFLIVYFLGRKGFCRFVCPWGAFLKIPTALSTFKVRKTGDCTHCNMCTQGCPIGIDVSYEINNFNKVINSNCTSCMVCIDDCPEHALSYKFQNPINEFENIGLKDFKFQSLSFTHTKIKNKFLSLRNKDFFIIPFAIIFGWLLDDLYTIGHFLSFGIAAILSILIVNKSLPSKIRYFIFSLSIILMFFNGYLKYSSLMGNHYYSTGKFSKALPYFENVVKYYPMKIGKYHLNLATCHYHTSISIDGIERCWYHFNLGKSRLSSSDSDLQSKINVLEQLIRAKEEYLRFKKYDSNN
tara:strand:- start:69 stop:1424 length:1356 start_codon:yes stop_codon:yes gene_type:complete